MYKDHAENERKPAQLVAQETVKDLFGGLQPRRNVPGLLLGVAFTLFLLGMAALVLVWLLGLGQPIQAQGAHTTWLPLVHGPAREFVLDCMDGTGRLISCDEVRP